MPEPRSARLRVLPSTERAEDTLLLVDDAAVLLSRVELRSLTDDLAARLAALDAAHEPDADADAAGADLPPWTETVELQDPLDTLGAPATAEAEAESVARLRGEVRELRQRVEALESPRQE